MKSRVLICLLILSCVGLVQGNKQVAALAVSSKPTTPEVSVISVTSGSSVGKVSVIVSFVRASTNVKAPILLTQVKVGDSTCTAVGKSTKCAIRNLAAGRTYRVAARAKNRNGYGSWGSTVSVIGTKGVTWRRSDTTSSPGSTASTTSLKFNLKNAVGLTLKSTVSSSSVHVAATGSNLQVVDATGATTDAVSSGSANVGKFLIAPNNKLYVLFSSKTMIGTTQCLLAEIARDTGDPVCIDSTLDSIQWSDENRWPGGSPIQFDDAGSIYYVGTAGSATVFRKFTSGISSDLINDNITIYNFMTRGDGSIFISGLTKSSSSGWLRRMSPGGSLTTLSAGSRAYSLYEMPDNHIWIGLWNAEFGIRRFSLETQTMISGYLYSSQKTPSVFAYPLSVCSGDGQSLNYDFCGWDGVFVQRLFRTVGGAVYAVAGSGKTGTLMRYFPNFSKPTTSVQRVSVSQQVLSYLILSGTNSSGQNITTLYNTSTDTEQVLIPSSNEIEIYHLNYVASSNKIMFDGLRFSDNKYVIGQIDLNTNQFTTAQTGSSKLIDFQTFGS